MSQAHGSGLFTGVTDTLRQDRHKRTILHELPPPGETFDAGDLDATISGELRWFANVGIVETIGKKPSNQGRIWQSTHHVPKLQDTYPAPTCGEDGILDCGGDCFVSTSEGLECKVCGGLTNVEDARSRKRGEA